MESSLRDQDKLDLFIISGVVTETIPKHVGLYKLRRLLEPIFAPDRVEYEVFRHTAATFICEYNFVLATCPQGSRFWTSEYFSLVQKGPISDIAYSQLWAWYNTACRYTYH